MLVLTQILHAEKGIIPKLRGQSVGNQNGEMRVYRTSNTAQRRQEKEKGGRAQRHKDTSCSSTQAVEWSNC